MYTLRIACSRWQEQHIALSEQVFRTHLIENRAAVDFAGYLERDACRNVGFDQACDDIDAGTLCGKDQMDTCRAGFLGETGNQFFDFLACGHHQVGKFVNHDDDERQFFQRFGIVGRQAERVGDFYAFCGSFHDFLIEACKVTNAYMTHQTVAFFHFVDAPVERVGCQLHIGNDRCEQVRNAFVNAQFQHFRVDHNHAHVFRRRFEEHR